LLLGLALSPPGALAATTIGPNILTTGSLTVDGAVKFTSGAALNSVLVTDATGNATWTAIDTSYVAENPARLYYTDVRADARITAQKGVLGGLATLDGAGKIPAGQLPAITISNVYVVADMAARALLTVETGDVAIVLNAGGGAGDSRTYIYDGAVWQELLDPTNIYLTKANNLSDLTNTATARTNLGLGNVEDIALSTWAGSANITTLGTISSAAGNVSLWTNDKGYLTAESDPDAVLKATFTANGDLLVGTGAGTYSALAAGVGNNGKILTVTAGVPSWQSPAGATNALSAVTAAVAANSINNGDNAQTWNWNLTNNNKSGITLGENIASTGTGTSIVNVSTLASSTAIPLVVNNVGAGDSFRVNDISADTSPFLIDKDGNVLIGAEILNPAFPEKLKVDSGSSASPTVIGAGGDINAQVKIGIQNRNAGLDALSVLAALADNGTSAINFAAMGIASSGFNDAINYPILGPNDAFLVTTGSNLIVGTAIPTKDIKFIAGTGFTTGAERMTISGTSGNVGIGTTSLNARLDLKPATADALRIEPYSTAAGNTGNLELMELVANGSNYVGFKAPDSIAANKIWTLPNADGTGGQVLSTDGSGVLSWINPTGMWQRVGIILSPTNVGDDITTSGDISTSGSGTITSVGLLTGSAGLTISGAAVSLNDNSNFDTTINTGISTGTVTIGSANAGAIQIISGAGLTLTGGAASNINTTASDLTFQPAGSGTTANVQIGAGQPGSTTPDVFSLDVKSTTGDPAGADGAMYYNEFNNKFRCHINGSWSDCDTTAGATTLQSAYNNGASITTAGGTDIAFNLTNIGDDFTVSGAGAVNLTPTGASSFTSSGALTLTGGAGSTWSTSAGALTLTSAAAATWGTSAGDLTLRANGGATNSVKIGTGGSGTPNLLVVDVKNTAGDPAGSPDGAMYYSTTFNSFRCHVNGGWQDCGAAAAAATTLQQAYVAGNTITTALADGDFNVTGTQAVNLTPTAASQFTSGAALTLTGGATSTWSTSSGNLTVDSAATLNLGTTNATAVNIGQAGVTTTSIGPLVVSGGTLQTGNAATAGNLLVFDGTANKVTITSPAISSDYTLTLPVDDGTSGQALITNGSGTLSWASLMTDPMSTRGDIIYRDATNTTARLGKGTVGQVLKSDGTDIAWSGLTSTDVGLSNVTNDAQLKQSIGTAKGDLITYTASNTPVRLPVGGTNGWILMVDSGQSSGMKWTAAVPPTDSLDFTEFNDAMTVDANTSINLANKSLTINDLVGGGAGILNMSTNGAALTLTAGAASTWSTSSGALTITSAAAATWGTSAGNLTLQAGSGTVSLGTSTNLTAAGALTIDSNTTSALNFGTGANAKTITIGNATTSTHVNILAGTGNITMGASDTTGTLLVLDTKTDAGDPAGANGGMYYNANTNKFRCYENGAWKDCNSAVTNLQTAYNGGATITTAGNNIAFILTSGNFTASGVGSVNLTPTGASSFTSAGALTLTGGAASTWSTSSGALIITSAAATTWSTTAGNLILQAGSGTVSLGTSSILTANDGLTISAGPASALTLTSPVAATWSTTAGALTLTSAAAATWSTSAGALTVDSAAALNLGSTNATSLVLGNDANTTATTIHTDALTVTTDGTGDAEVVLPNDSISSAEILDNTITTTDLNATLTFADGDFIDLSGINMSSTTEGLKLGQAASCASATAEGQICWDTDDDILYVGTSAAAKAINPINTVYNGTTAKTKAKIWNGTATTSSGQATLYPTSDGTAGGTALFTNIYSIQATAVRNTTTATQFEFASVNNISADKKTLVINVGNGTTVVLGGASIVDAPDGTSVYVTIIGD